MKPKILVISRDSWNDTNNSGNTLSNLFQNWDTENIANIYCRDEIPNNKICSNYFKISESLLLKKLLRKTAVAGVKVQKQETASKASEIKDEQKEKKIYDFFRKNRLHIFLWGRELLWKIVNWKSKELKDFIKDFNPDVIYSPSYDSFYMHDILKFVQKESGVRVVFFHCDDLVTYRQHSWSPLYWINRFILRKHMDKSIRLAAKNYCIIDEQSRVYKKIYNLDFDILYKTGDFTNLPQTHTPNTPLKLIYTGNIIYGRIHSLFSIADALKTINSEGIKAKLYLYTANEITSDVRHRLESSGSVEIMGKVPYSQIPGILNDGDILVHVESFEKQQMLATSLSFSTKIVDYLEAGRPIFAMGWKEAASIKYLHDNGIGVTANNNQEVLDKLKDLIDHTESLNDKGLKAWSFGKEKHNKDEVLKKFESDIEKVMAKSEIV
ncbi:glycosyltransferase involved in cell wall biosynthesis [Flavobacterium sp. 28YEA47A]|uniref:glycosyltransferase n=1 Tax=Flavobacterium sp. 28YEA47A TaxID=3156276 RepID=UPI00351847C4